MDKRKGKQAAGLEGEERGGEWKYRMGPWLVVLNNQNETTPCSVNDIGWLAEDKNRAKYEYDSVSGSPKGNDSNAHFLTFLL